MDKQPKDVGETFLLRCDKESSDWLREIARVATFCENAIWMHWRTHDPIQSAEVIGWEKVKADTGKWPKMQPYAIESGTVFARTVAPGLSSSVYDAVANHVRKLYPKKRWQFLRFDERLPVAKDLRIRFREKAVRIYRHPDNPDRWFQVGFRFEAGKERRFGLCPRGSSEYTWQWLAEMADSKEFPSGGAISLVRRKGKWKWQLALARSRRDGERESVEPIEGRYLSVYAPVEQDDFLYCDVTWPDKNGRPWRMRVEGHDMLLLKRRNENRRVTMGRNYHQSPKASGKGHGRKRAIRSKFLLSDHLRRHIDSWIENRSAAIVQFAVETKCGEVAMEDLSKRASNTLCIGPFPYFIFMGRVEQKCKDRKITFRKTKPLTDALGDMAEVG